MFPNSLDNKNYVKFFLKMQVPGHFPALESETPGEGPGRCLMSPSGVLPSPWVGGWLIDVHPPLLGSECLEVGTVLFTLATLPPARHLAHDRPQEIVFK